jgi:hypothetical protein
MSSALVVVSSKPRRMMNERAGEWEVRALRIIKRNYMKIKMCLVLLLSVSLGGYGQEVVSTATLLDEMTSLPSVARWPLHPYTMKQASSYDRRSVAADAPGWFANGDFNQFIRKEEKNGRTEYVMMDAEGPGAVVRFWLTTQVKAGQLRFYFDDAAEAAIEIPAYDLLQGGFHLGKGLLNPHSSYEPAGKGGNTLYLPLPYSRHCKITFECPDTTALKTSHYYQINYRTYAPGTKVKTFSRDDLTAYSAVIGKTEAALWTPPVYKGGREVSKHQAIAGGQQATLDLPAGGAAIRQLVIHITTADTAALEQAYRSTILQIDFDGQQTVWCPLGDFAGSGYGHKMISSWYRRLGADGTIVTRWVMPYQKTARITLINKAGFAVDASVTAAMERWHWDDRTMYFHTSYKYEAQIKDAKWDYDVTKVAARDTTAPIEWNFVKIRGRGIYLGNTLAVNNHMTAWYGEGDAKLWVDDDTFPSEFGTGLEDYYNTSWAPVVLYQTPFANAPRADNESSFGHNTFTRTRNLDGVPFSRSFGYDLEMLSWTGGDIDAAATVYWYGAPGAAMVSDHSKN